MLHADWVITGWQNLAHCHFLQHETCRLYALLALTNNRHFSLAATALMLLVLALLSDYCPNCDSAALNRCNYQQILVSAQTLVVLIVLAKYMGELPLSETAMYTDA